MKRNETKRKRTKARGLNAWMGGRSFRVDYSDGWMDGWMDGAVDGWIYCTAIFFDFAIEGCALLVLEDYDSLGNEPSYLLETNVHIWGTLKNDFESNMNRTKSGGARGARIAYWRERRGCELVWRSTRSRRCGSST